MLKTEAQTRKELIDIQLHKAGWNVNDRTQVVEEFDIAICLPEGVREARTKYEGHQFCDYVLLGKDGKPLAVVEAKKPSKDAEIGSEQARQYCYHIQKRYGGKLPFCFYTNGHDTFFWDLGNYPPRKVVGFATCEDLERLQYIRDFKKPLTEELINTRIAGRDYQIRAIRAVMEAIEKKQRKFLLVMATGTGKTRVCIGLVDALMRANWVERTLFLVDRVALREQGLEAFKEYLSDEPRWPKLGEKAIAKDRRIYVSTYPTMMNIIRSEYNSLSPHFFDLIVVDESHRSIYNTYKEILDYFQAITLGLTATPTDIIDHNTFSLFNCEDGIPTFAFSYEDALNHVPPYLCDFQAIKIRSRFQDEGISERTISLEDQKKMLLEGKEISEINFEGADLEKRVTNRGTNALIVKEFMEECIKDSNGVLPGKTIFFCASVNHARRIQEIFNSLYPEYCGELSKVLVSDDPRVYGKGGLLDQFTNCDMPRIAISVDMLDTGIDIREVVNLVFVKQVFSYTKFWQMIGRGTRLLEPTKLRPWCQEKDIFLIMDCWDNFDYFKLKPKGKELKPQIPLPVRFFGIRLDKLEASLAVDNAEITRKEINKLHQQINDLPKNSAVIIDAAADIARLNDDSFWMTLSADKIGFLRTRIKPLFKTLSQADFKAMRFEKDVLETSLAALTKDIGKYQTLKDNLIEQISELPLSVNIVAQEKMLITKALTGVYWDSVSDSDFDELAARLAPLMKFRESARPVTGLTKLDLKDILNTKEVIEFGPANESIHIAKYREMVEEMVVRLTLENPILQKIKNGEAINQADTDELAHALYDQHPHVTEEILRTVYKNRKAKFLQFIRHIMGLEQLEEFPEVVSKAFEKFVSEHSCLSVRQLDFLRLLKEFIIDRENLHRRDLIQAPFTSLHPQGIRGLFSPTEIDEILNLTERLVA